MIQRTATTNVPAEIAARIVDVVRPWRIVLFGSHARGTQKSASDYDIFVEIDADNSTLKDLRGQLLHACRDERWSLDLHVRQRGAIERRRDDPGTLEWDVAREGKVLFADPAASIDIAPPDRVREPSPELPESVYEWLELARRDMKHWRALQALSDDYSPEICGLTQQSGEKHLKALLVARRVRPPRTHSLTELLGALRKNGCPLPELDADCELLTKHAVDPRYGPGLHLGPEDAAAAIAAAERIASAVREQLPPMLH